MTVLMITIDGGTLSYDVSGAGPPIVFAAGLGEHGTYWMAQVAAFFLCIPSRDFRSWRGGREQGPVGPRTRCGSSITWVSTACIWSDIRPAVPLRKCSQPIIPTVSRPSSSAQRGARLDARLRRLFTFRKRALYEQVGFDRRRASRMTPQKTAAARIGA